jgi:hypothetical protein
MPPNRPRLSLADVMIVVGTSGVSLSIYMLLDNGLFNGLIVCAGTSVAAVWTVQIVTGQWRPGANGFDRLDIVTLRHPPV